MNIQNITSSPLTNYTANTGNQADTDKSYEMQDKVTLSGEKSTRQKIMELPRIVAKGVVGSTFALASAVLHTPCGTLEGIDEALCQDFDNFDTRWFTGVTLAEFTLGGAAAGWCMGGPITAVIGGGIGFVVGSLVRAIEGKAGFPERFVSKVEAAVDEAVKDNHWDSKIREVTQNLTEGALTGTVVGFKESLKEGYRAGEGVVDGVCDIISGVGQGIKDVFKK